MHATRTQPTIRRLGEPGDLGWVIQGHGEVYDTEFGWNTDFEALVAQIVTDFAADHDPKREAAWIAELASRRVGCIFLVADPDDPATAKLRILLVHPGAAATASAGTWSTSASTSRARPSMCACACGPTTLSKRRDGSIWHAASPSPTSNRITPSASTSSARPTS